MNAFRPFHLVLRGVAPIAALFGSLLIAPAPLSAAPAVNTVASGLSNPSALAIDGDYIYFGQLSGATGTLHRVPKAGTNGNPLPPLATNAVLFESGQYRGIDRLAFDPTHVYYGFGGYTNYLINKVPKAGGTPGNPIAQLGAPLLGVIGSDVYYARNFCCIDKVENFGAGTTTTVLPNALAPSSLWVRNFAIDGTNIYFQHYSTRDVYRFDTVSGIPTPLITGNAVEGALFVDATNIYLHRGASIVKVPKAGGSLSTVHTGAITQLNAASNGKVYYTENGNLYEVSADIDAPTLLASGVSVASATIDSTAFYWADTISGTISRVELNSTLIVFRYPVGPQGWSKRGHGFGSLNLKSSIRLSDPFAPHLGQDWNINTGGPTDKGSPVVAVADGTVLAINYECPKTTPPKSAPVGTTCESTSGWGVTVLVEHAAPAGQYFLTGRGEKVKKVYANYAHLLPVGDAGYKAPMNIQVPIGGLIKNGDPVGQVGSPPFKRTADAVYHLHFEMLLQADAQTYRKQAGYGWDLTHLITHNLARQPSPA